MVWMMKRAWPEMDDEGVRGFVRVLGYSAHKYCRKEGCNTCAAQQLQPEGGRCGSHDAESGGGCICMLPVEE